MALINTTLSLLQLISLLKPNNYPNYSDRDYKREDLSFYSKEYNNQDPFKKGGYPICTPASNLECYYWTGFDSKIVKFCPKMKVWVGIGEEVAEMKDWKMTVNDKIAYRQHESEIPESWLRKDCSVDGTYGMAECSDGDYLHERKTQVVFLKGEWVAVKSVSVLVADEPYAKTCWQSSKVVALCNNTIPDSCRCVEYPIKTIYVQRSNRKIAVDGVGIRTYHIAQHRPDQRTGICELTKRDGEWYIESDRNLIEFKIVSKKGSHEMVCDPDDAGHVCYGKGWEIFNGELKVSLYRDGILYASCTADDEADQLCSEISYFYRWKHYQCWSFLEHALLTIIILVTLTLLSIITLACCTIWSKCFACMWWCCLPIRFIGGSLRKRQAKREDLYKLLEEGNSENVFKPKPPTDRSSLNLKKAALGILLASNIKDVRADCTSLEMLSFQSLCSNDQCVLKGNAITWLPSRSGVACFDARGPDDKLMDLSFELHIDQVLRKCIPFDSYWTADYHPKACSEFHCPSTCWTIKEENKWEYLQSCGVTPNTLIIKQSHQGCAGVGCVRCDDACVLYSKFFVMDSQTRPVKIFKCSDWVPEMRGRVVKRTGLNSTYTDFKITSLEPVTLLGVKFQWNYDTSPFTFFQTESFLSESGRVCMTHASRKGSPVKGQLGYIQCSSENNTFSPSSCIQMQDSIECTVGNKAEVHCTHQSPKWERICQKSWLPLEKGSVYLTVVDDLPAISAHDFGLSQISLTLEEGEIARFIEPKSSCKILDGSVSGCYQCDGGATLDLTSHPVNGAPVIRVRCEKSIANFRFVCGENPITIYASESIVDTPCQAFWGSKSASFKIKGILTELIDLPSITSNGSLNHVIDRSWQMPGIGAFKIHLAIAGVSTFLLLFLGLFLWCNCRR